MIAEISLALQWEAGGVGSIPAEEQNSTCLKVQPKKKRMIAGEVQMSGV